MTYYTVRVAHRLKEGSLKEISICINNHIKPHIEDKPLNEINGLDIQKALNKITTSRTKKYTYNVFNGAFKQATQLKIITENIMQSVETVQYKYKNGKALTKEQQMYFYNVILKTNLNHFMISY